MQDPNQPSPVHFFQMITAYQASAALGAGIELGLFTAVAEGAATVPELAARCQASERGTRILADYLVVTGFLTKQEGRYGLTQDSAVFLNQRSPAYVGGAARFLRAPTLMSAFDDFAEVVRTGTTHLPAEGSVAPDHPVWVDFARGMGPLMALPARELPRFVDRPADEPLRVLDIAAGHGRFGIAFLEQFPRAEVTAVDWDAVLDVAEENARAAGVADRWRRLVGNAFEVEYGSGYDVALLTNFLHHFDAPTNVSLLRKVRESLAEGGVVVTMEFVPNEDRVSPPNSAGFPLVMLASTPAGDAYTLGEFDAMFREAGFGASALHRLPMMGDVIVTRR